MNAHFKVCLTVIAANSETVKASGGYWLFSFTAVGIIYHHASTEACFHGLCCDQLQLEREDEKWM